MEIPIVVEPFDGGWRARCRHPVEVSATGGTRHEATQALESELRKTVPGTFIVLPLEVSPDKPWVASAGGVPDDETTETWLDAIAEYRRLNDTADQQSVASPPSQPVP